MANREIELCIRKAVDDYVDHLDGEANIEGMYHLILDEAESALIRYALEHHEYNQTQTAKWLGLTRNTLKKKMLIYKLDHS